MWDHQVTHFLGLSEGKALKSKITVEGDPKHTKKYMGGGAASALVSLRGGGGGRNALRL